MLSGTVRTILIALAISENCTHSLPSYLSLEELIRAYLPAGCLLSLEFEKWKQAVRETDC